jgi:hypothetical protein
MALYLIAFNDEWVPDLTLEELRERGTSGRALIDEMTAAGVFVFSDGGLDASTVVCSVDPGSGSPVFTDGPFGETKEHLGGFAVVDVPGDAEARYWAGRIAVAVGWPQGVLPRAWTHGRRRPATTPRSAYALVSGLYLARRRAVCKTVGSAYVGWNPTPATTCENGPLAVHMRHGGPFFSVPPCVAL